MRSIKMFEIFLGKIFGIGISYEHNERLLYLQFTCFIFAIDFKAEFGFNFINKF